MNVEDRKHVCNICVKSYSSSSSLWNHNNKFHNPVVSLCCPNVSNFEKNVSQSYPNVSQNSLICDFCKKVFKFRSSKSKHKKICKLNTCKEINNLKLEIEKLKNNKSINTTNNNQNNINNQNNGTINNITINQFGKENINALTIKDIKQLIKNDNYLVDIVKLLNFNEKFPENHNFCNTSLEGKYISVFNSDTNIVEKINKNDFYEKVLCNSFDKMDNLSLILELNNDVKEQIKEKYKEHLDNKLTHIRDIFYKDKIYKKNYKTNINELSYNKNKVVLDTWATVPEITNEDELSDSETSKYSALTSDSSDDENN